MERVYPICSCRTIGEHTIASVEAARRSVERPVFSASREMRMTGSDSVQHRYCQSEICTRAWSPSFSLSAPASCPAPAAPRATCRRSATSFRAQTLSSNGPASTSATAGPTSSKRIDVGATTPGLVAPSALSIPLGCGIATRPSYSRAVEGDFDVRARVRVRGCEQRDARRHLVTRRADGPRSQRDRIRTTGSRGGENWHFITTGVGLERGQAVDRDQGHLSIAIPRSSFRPFGARLGGAAAGPRRHDLIRARARPWRGPMAGARPLLPDGADRPYAGRADRLYGQRRRPPRPRRCGQGQQQRQPRSPRRHVDGRRLDPFRAASGPRSTGPGRSPVRAHPLADPNLAESTISRRLGRSALGEVGIA